MFNELQFGMPVFLWGMLAAPVFMAAMVLVYFVRQKKLSRFAEKQSLEKISSEFSPLRFFLKAIALTLCLVFLLFAAAQPKYGMKNVPVQRKGVDLVIALDVSKSMDTNDVLPSRLQRARKSIETLLSKLAGDRIGLVAFAGEAILLHPLTTEASGFMISLDTLDTDMVSVFGTSLGEAIKISRKAFEERSVKNKVLILITDGETHDENALAEARQAHEEGITIHCLGIGTPEGKPVPEVIESGKITRFKKNRGRYVISKLNSSLLQQIASEGDGDFFHFTGTDDVLDLLYDNISRMGEAETTSRFQEMMNDIYQYPLALAVLFLGVSISLSNRRREGKR
jgi:Ca-activated chloride channel family protein